MSVSQVASSWVSMRLSWEGTWADMEKAGVGNVYKLMTETSAT